MELAFRRWPQSTQPSPELKPKERAGKLVLLHGMGGTGALWRPIAAGLEDEFEILAVDQRGHGGSQILPASTPSLPPTYAPLDYGADVLDTMKSQEFSPAILVGHSMGVRTASAAAHLDPSAVQGLVLIDLGFSGPAGGGLGDGLADFLQILPPSFPNRETARAFMKDHCPDPSIGQYLLAVLPPAVGEVTFPFDRRALIATLEAARQGSIRPWIQDLGRRGLPVLVLRGGESRVWSKAEYDGERAAFQGIPAVQFEEFAGASHGLPFEKRLAFTERLREFARHCQQTARLT